MFEGIVILGPFVGPRRSHNGCSSIAIRIPLGSRAIRKLFRARSWLMGNLIFAAPEFGNIVSGVLTPVLAKHSKSFSLIDCISVGVDRMQRNFEPMRKKVEAGREVT